MNDPTGAVQRRELAARVAALEAIRDAIGEEVKATKAKMLADASGMDKATISTPYGRVLITSKDEHVEFITERFLAWVKENHPDEVVTTESVNPAFQRAILARLTTVGTDVVDKITGEYVDYAYLTDRGMPYVTYPASTEQKDAKLLARMYVEEGVQKLVAGLGELHPAIAAGEPA